MIILNKNEKNDNQHGFTLIELSVVILIFGIIIASLAPIYNAYIKERSETVTRTNLSAISINLSEFLAVQGRYPCPSPPRTSRDDPFYGRESSECQAASIAISTCNDTPANPITDASTATSGICVEQSPKGVAVSERIIIGSLPFRELNLDEDEVFDGYGNQITYAVTAAMANSDTFNKDNGGINILDLSGQSILPDNPATAAINESASSAFFIMSHGANGYGAYNQNGIKISCDNASTIEQENCTNEGTEGTFSIAQKSNKRSAILLDNTEYDDLSIAFVNADIPYWQLNNGPNEDIVIVAEDESVGMLSPNPYTTTLEQELDVGGIVRARERARSDQLCTYNNDRECFRPELIASAEGISCDNPDEYLVAIDTGQFRCIDEVVSACDPNEYITGVNVDGSPVCSPALPANCEVTQIELCPTVGDPAVIVPALLNGEETDWIESQSFPGNRRGARFRCNNGNIETIEERGICECEEGVLEVLDPIPCGGCQNGTVQFQIENSCPENIPVRAVVESNCRCTASALAGNCRRTTRSGCGDTGLVPSDPNNPPLFQQLFNCSSLEFDPETQVPGTGTCICDEQPDRFATLECSLFRTGFTERVPGVQIPFISEWSCDLTPPGYGYYDLDPNQTANGISDFLEAFDYYCECDSTQPAQTYTRSCDQVIGTATQSYDGEIPYIQDWNCNLDPPQYAMARIDYGTTGFTSPEQFCTPRAPVQCVWTPESTPRSSSFGNGNNLNVSRERLCDCSDDTEAEPCYRTLGSSGTAIQYDSCICQVR